MSGSSVSSRTPTPELLPASSGEGQDSRATDPEVDELIEVWLEDARRHLDWFGEFVFRDDEGKPLQPARHHRVWIAALEGIEAGELKRVLIIAPPGHAKTEWCSKVFPSWYLGRHPEQHLIGGSATASLANLISVSIRDTIDQSPDYQAVFPEAKPDKDKGWAEFEWFLWRENRSDKDASYSSAGVDGPVIGRRAEGAILDDPYNEEIANSPTAQRRVKLWFKRTLMSRLKKNAWALVVMTRWVPHDLAEDLINQGWLTVHMPALSEEGAEARISGTPGDVAVMRRRLAEAGFVRFDEIEKPQGPEGSAGFRAWIHDDPALWPDEYPEAMLVERRRESGSIVFDAMYQGNPRAEKGHLFKSSYLRYFEEEPEFYVLHRPTGEHRVSKSACWSFQTCDVAASTKETADFFVVSTWIATPERDLLLKNVFRERLEGPDHKGLMRTQYQRYRPAVQGVEDKSFGLTLVQELVREGLPVVPLKADVDKRARAIPMAARYEAGTVYHLTGAPWLDEYEAELLEFTGDGSGHDDQVDTAAYAARLLADLAEILATAPAQQTTAVDAYEDISPY